MVVALSLGRAQRQFIFPAVHPLLGAAGDLPAQLRHGLAKRSPQRVVSALGENVRAGRDEVNIHLMRRAGVFESRKPDIRLVNLARPAQREDLLFQPRIQLVQWAEV